MFHLSRIVERALRLHGDRPAIVDGDTRMDYRGLMGRAYRLAGALAGMGLRPGDRVAVFDRNSFRYLELNYACALAGFVLVPLNLRLSVVEIGAILDSVEAGALFVGGAHAARLAGLPPRCPTFGWGDADGLGVDNDYERLLAGAAPYDGPIGADVDAVAQIFFTSGTTGDPKGVCLTSRNLVTSAFDSIIALEVSRDDVWFHAAPMFHLVDAFAVWTMSLVGCRHVAAHFDEEGFVRAVRDEKVTKTSLPPTLINMIAQSGAKRADLASLTRISYGGSPMPEAVYERARQTFDALLLAAYGISEVSGLVCQQVPDDLAPGSAAPWRGVGQAVAHIDLGIVDDDGNMLPAGEPGEIVVRGDRVMAGYWRKPEATAAAIRQGWYHTGDIGSIDERGHLVILDRKKDMIITGGENVYSAEVENALSRHPDVVEAAVFGVPSERWGEEVKAVVYLREGASATSADLIDHCRRLIGGYKVPKSVDIERVPLPKSGPGKIAKHLLREPHWAGRRLKI